MKETMQGNRVMPYIIFVSSHTSCMKECFGNKVIGFAEKPITSNQVEQYLKRVELLVGKEDKIQVNEQTLSTNSVYLIGAMGVYTKICTVESTPRKNDRISAQQYLEEEGILARKTIGYWEEQLQNSKFIKVHRKYIVNLEYVTSFHGEEIQLEHNIVVPVSKRLRQEVRQHYIAYCREMAGDLCV